MFFGRDWGLASPRCYHVMRNSLVVSRNFCSSKLVCKCVCNQIFEIKIRRIMTQSSGALDNISSVRWAFNFRTWNPTESEWLLASRCIDLDDKEKVKKFVFKKDAKACMAGRLLMRKFVHLATGIPYEDVNIKRDEKGRPFADGKKGSLDFNISHQGSFTVLAGEINTDLTLGVDVMDLQHKRGKDLKEFFRLMKRVCTDSEWNCIMSSNVDDKCSDLFFRHWCLKESYLKAVGLGVYEQGLRLASFKVNTLDLSQNKACTDSVLYVHGKESPEWCFHEWLLDSNHCVSVALSSRSEKRPTVQPVAFKILDWTDLIIDAKPILPPDVSYTEEFMEKEEGR